LGLLTTCAAQFSAASAARADDPSCGTLSPALRVDPANSSAFTRLGIQNLYRFQARPYMRLPLGVAVAVRAPEGTSEADVHRAAMCAASSESSPLAVPGRNVRVVRNGGHYELHITASSQSAAREIQRRAAQLP
jgi:hypothetical protein